MRCADDNNNVADIRELSHRVLTILGRVTNILATGSNQMRKARAQYLYKFSCLIGRECRLCHTTDMLWARGLNCQGFGNSFYDKNAVTVWVVVVPENPLY